MEPASCIANKSLSLHHQFMIDHLIKLLTKKGEE